MLGNIYPKPWCLLPNIEITCKLSRPLKQFGNLWKCKGSKIGYFWPQKCGQKPRFKIYHIIILIKILSQSGAKQIKDATWFLAGSLLIGGCWLSFANRGMCPFLEAPHSVYRVSGGSSSKCYRKCVSYIYIYV